MEETILLIVNNLLFVGRFLLSLWWIYLPIFLFIIAKDLWIKYVRQRFIQDIDWVLLEIIPPKEIKKTPRAMEQFFCGLHGTQSTPTWKERHLEGLFQRWFSLEMVSLGGEVHFFIRTPAIFRNLVEAQIYAQYPEAEIFEVSDYVDLVPSDMPNKDYDLWGTELMLIKEDAYPIRTYSAFEKDILMEEQRIDPMAALLEVMSKIEPGEHIWIQTLIRPVNDSWQKEAEALRDKLIGRKPAVEQGLLGRFFSALVGGFSEVLSQILTGQPPEPKKEEKPSSINPMDLMTKGERDVITAIEENVSKIGFEVIIRFIYIGRADVFKRANVAAVIGSFKQFNTQNLNGFKPNAKITTAIDYKIQAKHTREAYRKKRIFNDYKRRYFAQYSSVISYLKPLFFERWPILNWFFIRSKPFIFNVEELATIYHLPAFMVKAPLRPRVEAKKGEPPTGLPV